jgi:hypothetical protein
MAHTPNPFRLGEVGKQAVSDWFGKDVQSGYTLTYVWMANELGHFTLGFIPACIGAWIWRLCDPCASACGWMSALPVALALLWAVKELRDVVVEWQHAHRSKGFPVDLRSIALDALTAVLFFTAGIAVSYLAFVDLRAALLAMAATVAPALLIGYYWLSRKMCFQQVGLPFQYRLSCFSRELTGAATLTTDQISRFCDPSSGAGDLRHVLVFGARGTQKTSLAVGMATEWAFGRGKARYLTLFKLLQAPASESRVVSQDGRSLWGWSGADFVVVDDVCPASPQGAEAAAQNALCDPNAFEQCMRHASSGGASGKLKALAGKRTVWVIGEGSRSNAWVQVFEKLGFGDAASIGVVHIR